MVTGCNSSVNTPIRSAPTIGTTSGGYQAATSSTTTASSSTTTASKGLSVGATVSSGGFDGNPADTADVTLVKIIDPAEGLSPSYVPDQGDRFVSAEFTITNTTSTYLTGNVNIAVDLTGSDGRTYSADQSNVAGCHNFEEDSGQFGLLAGSSETGCVTFQLPTGVKAARVTFGGGADAVTWVVK